MSDNRKEIIVRELCSQCGFTYRDCPLSERLNQGFICDYCVSLNNFQKSLLVDIERLQ